MLFMVKEVDPYGLITFAALEMRLVCWTALTVELESPDITVGMMMMLELSVQVF